MQVVTDPDNYEASQIVQKSSKSGIFSNKRLLVIKNGFLYYFTNVPKNYKSHVPNILNTLKQLPKSSIEIKAINQIKMQSSNSTNLIIKFYEKDMIEREDIRKSISDQNFKYTKKNTQELEEWKFTYAKVLNCRLWYTALLKLKAYFSKQEDKIEEFFNNFDPVKRNSHMPTMNKDPSSGSLKNYRASQMVSQFKRQDQNSDFSKKQPQISIPPITLQPNSPKKQPQSPQLQPQPQQPQAPQKQQFPFLIQNNSENKLETINEDDEIVNKKIEDEYRQQIQEQIRLEEKKKNQKLIQGIKSQLQSKNQKIKILEEAIKATDKLRAKEEEAREKEREKERMRQEEIERELEKQRQKLKLKEELERNRVKQRQRQRQREKARARQRQRQNNEYGVQKQKQSELYITPPLSLDMEGDQARRTIQLQQFSVQTDGQQQQQSYIPNRKRFTNESYLSGLGSTQRDTYNIFRNAGSLSFQLQQKDRSYENYDYYTQVEAIHNPDIKFEQKIKKQIKLINYVNKMKNVALDALRQYIDDNNPTKSVSFLGTLFQTHVVCEHGKNININGQEKLVYSNQQHQRLKRQFKIYNYLQDMFIQITEKRKKFPLRVPLCFFFQYRGYSALLKYMPYIKEIELQEETERGYKLLAKVVQQQYIENYTLHLIANRPTNLYMVTVKNVYKITKQQPLVWQLDSNQIYGPKFLSKAKDRLVSTNSSLLEQQIKKLSKNKDQESMKKIIGIKQALLCRALKKLYRSTQPFSYDSVNHVRNTDFFAGVLSFKQKVCSLVSDFSNIPFNGLFVSYFKYFFGLEVPSDFDIYNYNLEECQFNYSPLSRSFNFNSLYPTKLHKNLQKYISSQKQDLAQTAFSILSQLDNPHTSIALLKIKHKLKQTTQIDMSTIEDMLKTLQQIRNTTDRHDTIWIQSYMLTIQCQTLGKLYKECLQTIYQTLGYISYMFGAEWSQGYIEDYLCLLVGQTLAKMGNYGHSMTVYKKMLANTKCTLSQEQISLSIADVFYHFGQVDPYTLIQFLLSLIPAQSSNEPLTQTHSKLHQQLGHLYQTLHNPDLSIKHLQKSLQYYQSSGIRNQEQVHNLIQICLSLYNTYQCINDKAIIFAKLLLMVEVNSKNQKFSVHIVRMVRAFVTACFCEEVRAIGRERRERLGTVLEELRDGDAIVPQFVHPVSYDDLIRTIQKLEQRAQLGQKQAKVMQLLDLSQIQTFILTCQ